MDSGFCVLKGIGEMIKRGVYGQVLIKMCETSWSMSMPGHEIDDYFSGLGIGKTETIKQALDGVDFLFIVRRRRSI